jgi:hypothetical protein
MVRSASKQAGFACFLPSDVPLRADDQAGPQTLWPTGGAGDSVVHKFEVTYLYDLRAPGKYTAYAEVMDPSSHQ